MLDMPINTFYMVVWFRLVPVVWYIQSALLLLVRKKEEEA